MAQNTLQAWSYDDKAIREDLLDVMTNIDPTEWSFQDEIATSTASAILHEWPTDTLDAVGDNATIQGADVANSSMTNPTRVQNLVQTFTKPWKVPGIQQSLDHAGISSRKGYEIGKKLKALKNDFEYALLRGSLISGNGTNVADRLKGVKNAITTNATSQSGVSLTQTILDSYLSLSWTNGGRVDKILVGATLKQRISAFSANQTRYIGADEEKLVNTINLYSSDFGAPVIEMKLHRYVTVSGDTNNDILLLQSDTWGKAYVRKPQNEDLSKAGDYDRGQLIADATLEFRAEKANVYGKALY